MNAGKLRHVAIVIFACSTNFSYSTENLGSMLANRVTTIPERGQVTNRVFHLPSQDLVFLPPQNWRMQFDTNRACIKWITPDMATSLTLQILDQKQAPVYKHSALQEYVQSQFPKGKIIDEVLCPTRGEAAMGFDTSHVVAEKFRMRTRTTFLPFKGGIVLVELTTSSDQFHKRLVDLGWFLNSLSIDPR